jgi:hypothetical protein
MQLSTRCNNGAAPGATLVLSDGSAAKPLKMMGGPYGVIWNVPPDELALESLRYANLASQSTLLIKRQR